MFGLFKPKSPVDAREKAWIETRLSWLSGKLGSALILESQVVLPSDGFLADFNESELAAREIFNELCRRMQLNADEIELLFVPELEIPGAAGLYEPRGKSAIIRIAEPQLDDGESLLSTMVHELSHHVLLGGNILTAECPDHELITDLLCVYFGLGIFSANAVIREKSGQSGALHYWQIARHGYLSARELGYALAVYSWVRRETSPSWMQYLRLDARSSMTRGLKYLKATNDCLFLPDGPVDCQEISDSRLKADLESQFEGVRVNALWAIRDRRSASVTIMRAVAALLRDRNPIVRAEAALALGEVGPAAFETVDRLLIALDDPHPEMRAAAVSALGKIDGDAGAILPAIGALLQDESRDVVEQTVGAIGRFGPNGIGLQRNLLAALNRTIVDGKPKLSAHIFSTLAQSTPDVRAVIEQYFADDSDPRYEALSLFDGTPEETTSEGPPTEASVGSAIEK